MKTVVAMLLVGLVQLAAYFAADWFAVPGGGYPVAQGDTGAYVQAALRIIEGHPFSIARDLPPATGTTSVLYPFVLAGPIALFGLRGFDALAVSFWVNALCYLVFLAGWGAVIARLFAPGPARFAAAALVALSGHAAGVAFAQSDIGLFMAATAILAWALASARQRLALALLCLVPWLRPEGMMLVLAWLALQLLRRLTLNSQRSTRNLQLLLPVLSCLGVFALNFALTGECQFSSVAEKGYFKKLPFAAAAVSSLCDLGEILASYLASVPTGPTRLFSMPSPVAALCFWLGLGVLFRRHAQPSTPNSQLSTPDSILLIFPIAAAMAIASIAQSGFAGIQYDRYLGWMVPLLAIVSALGFGWAYGHLRRSLAKKLLTSALVVGALFSSVSSPCIMHQLSASMHGVVAAHAATNAAFPDDPTVGDFFFGSSFAYSGRRWVNLCGIYDRRYRDCPNLCLLPDFLKHHPELRFDVWAINLNVEEKMRLAEDELTARYGRRLPGGIDIAHGRRADWRIYDNAAKAPPAPDGMALADTLDVGYLADERAHGLAFPSGGFCGECCDACAFRAEGDEAIVESGRLCKPALSFDLSTKSGTDAVLVLRVLGRVRDETRLPIVLPENLELTVDVDGQAVAVPPKAISPCEFEEVSVRLDGALFKNTRSHITLRGTFAAFGAWLFQKTGERIPEEAI